MTAALRVLAPGVLTTLQDLGRPGYQQLGIPVGGALDPLSLRAANVLVGNPARCGALEVAYAAPTLMVEAPSARLAFAGADAKIEVFSGTNARRGRTVETMRSIRFLQGDCIRIGLLARGAVLYLAV